MERGGFNGYRKIPNASSGKVYVGRELRDMHFICLYISCLSFSHERMKNKLKIVSFY